MRPAGYTEHYRDRRFASGTGRRTHRRECAAVDALLAGVAGGARPRAWLDVPSGAGRMSGRLLGTVVQVDRSLDMLRAAGHDHARVCASAATLPFRDGAFTGCLCLRLLHHVPSSAERIRILSELRRVTDGPVVVSFFHAASLQHARRVLARRLGKPRSGRTATTWRRFREDLRAAGLAPRAVRPLWRYVSEQWIVRAERT